VSSGNSIERLTNYLQTPQHAFEGARPHHLLFTALIIIPSLNYPTAPVATIAPSHFSDLLNTRLLHPILVTQSFLPLLISLPFSHPHHHSPPRPPPSPPKVLLLTPNIISSLSPPFHAPESLVVSALTAFTRSLSAELAPLGIPVTQIQMGSFDISSFNPRNQLQAQNIHAQRAEMLCWPEGTRQAYGRNFLTVAERGSSGALRGGPLRELHNAVFDAMTRRNGGVVKAGMGSAMYGFVGAWAPRSLVGWMMGVQRVKRLGQSPLGSETGSDSHKEEAGLAGDSVYISVGQ
jgi:NAD(P)-dependent dehydrogenase (short-subunit alcohol dehydrogenase family)